MSEFQITTFEITNHLPSASPIIVIIDPTGNITKSPNIALAWSMTIAEIASKKLKKNVI